MTSIFNLQIPQYLTNFQTVECDIHMLEHLNDEMLFKICWVELVFLVLYLVFFHFQKLNKRKSGEFTVIQQKQEKQSFN